MRSASVLLAFALSLAAVCPAQQPPTQQPPAQQPPSQLPQQPEDVIFRVQSQLVQVYMTVTEGNRRVTDLKLSDFTVAEDGMPREMDRLDSATVPLYVALLLDTSESMRDALSVTQEAAVSFVEALSPTDRVTLVPFNSDIRAMSQLTDDRRPIIDAIRATQARGGTKLYDALLFGMKHLSGKEGRKAIVVFSDGEDTARSSSINIALNAAARYGFPIYTIGAGAGLRRDTLKRVLRQFSEINSGKMYLVEDPQELRGAFQEVASELHSAYVLNYYTSVPFDGRWHDLKISLSNPHCRVHSRKGFYARPGGTSSLLTEITDSPRGGGALTADGPIDEKAARAAQDELLQEKVEARDVEIQRPQLPVPRRANASAGEAQKPVFKVEARFVEVPVVVESASEKEVRTLAEKDFRVYEDDQLREIAFFSRDTGTQKIAQLRDLAMQKVSGSKSDGSITLSADSQELRLGRYYLVLDDLMTDIASFLQTKKAAEKIVRDYFNPLRPLSLHFTSEGAADVAPEANMEKMLVRVRKAMARSSRDLTTNDNIISIYEAYLIERGDSQAARLAELRYASSIFVQFRNDLGEVDGQTGVSPEVIQNTVLNNARQLLSENFGQLSRALDGLRAVVNAASADTTAGDYPRVVIFLSTGFSLGRGSGRADMAVMLDNIIAQAKRSKVRVFTVDAGGLSPDEPLGIGASGSFLVRNPHLGSILSDHARGWRSDKQSPLSQIAQETGGRFLHSTNDLATAAGAALRTTGQLYYLGFLSKQPADSRFHRIRVTTALTGASVHARKGYFAGRETEPEPTAVTDSGESWDALLERANRARRAGDMKELAGALEQLVRRHPNQSDLWYNLGAAYFNMGNAPRAVDALQKAFALAPDDRSIGLTLARAFIAAGYRAAASETLELMARKQPRDIDLLMNLGRVYESGARTQDAYQTYRRVLDLQLSPPLDLYVLLTRTSMRLGRHVEAGLFIEDYQSRGGASTEVESLRKQLPAAPASPQR